MIAEDPNNAAVDEFGNKMYKNRRTVSIFIDGLRHSMTMKRAESIVGKEKNDSVLKDCLLHGC